MNVETTLCAGWVRGCKNTLDEGIKASYPPSNNDNIVSFDRNSWCALWKTSTCFQEMFLDNVVSFVRSTDKGDSNVFSIFRNLHQRIASLDPKILIIEIKVKLSGPSH